MDRALLARVKKQAWFHRYPRGVPFALLCFGLLMTLAIVVGIERADESARAVRLDRDATSLGAELQRKAAENIAYLNAAASLFAVADQVSRQEFTRFVEDMSAGHRSRGSLGLGWAAWMRASEIDAYEEQQRELLMSRAFHVRPRPASGEARMAVIGLLEPQTPANFFALGFDMYSERVRREAMDAALRSGRPAVAGILIYVPVFERAETGSRRTRGALKGFVYTPIRMSEFLDAAMSELRGTAAVITIYDGPVAEANRLAMTPGSRQDRLAQVRSVQIGNREWTMVFTSTEPRGLTLASQLVLVLGTIISMLLMALAWLMTNRAAEDQRVVEWLPRQAAIRTSLTRELNHRVKNTLANVLSIVALTRRRS
ncbi:MAG TPA: CHASE domain-containing protein, partial [Novosphingobium sp.]|nr:CHASE domain-containing protein [Novosphingobium sp.]